MRPYSFVQTIRIILLAIALLILAAIWQRSWQPTAEERKERLFEAELSTMVESAVDFEQMVLRVDSQPVRRSSPRRVVTAYRALDGGGRTIGYVIPFKGQGYQYDIEGMVAVNATSQNILRLTITESRDSPDENLFQRSQDFIQHFQGVDCRSPVRLMLPSDKGIHAITGSSISSQIVVRFLNEQIQALKNHLQQANEQAKGTG